MPTDHDILRDSIAGTFRMYMSMKVDEALRGVRDGTPKVARNPFTNEEVTFDMPESALEVREHLVQSGGVDLDQFAKSLGTLMRDVCEGVAEELLKAADGNGLWANDVDAFFCDRDGKRLDGSLMDAWSAQQWHSSFEGRD